MCRRAVSPSCGWVLVLVDASPSDDTLEVRRCLGITPRVGNGSAHASLDRLRGVTAVTGGQLRDALEHDRQTHAVASYGVRGAHEVGDGRVPELVIEDIGGQVRRPLVLRRGFAHQGIEDRTEKQAREEAVIGLVLRGRREVDDGLFCAQ